MDGILNYIKTDTFLIIITVLIILLMFGYIINTIKLHNLRNGYKAFMRKLGNGKDIAEDLQNYLERVEKIEEHINEIENYCKMLNSNMTGCIQKVGTIRYSAFKDTGSDLSFAVALLDEKNDGVLFNGIYSREMSNIYAKPIVNGKSEYTLTQEEEEALEKAMNNKV